MNQNATPTADAATDASSKQPTAAKVKVPRGPTKADKAREIFTGMPGAARKDVVAKFVTEIGLSEAAAATYYQNIKAKAAKDTTAPIA